MLKVGWGWLLFKVLKVMFQEWAKWSQAGK